MLEDDRDGARAYCDRHQLFGLKTHNGIVASTTPFHQRAQDAIGAAQS
jgi:hypothetical protein